MIPQTFDYNTCLAHPVDNGPDHCDALLWQDVERAKNAEDGQYQVGPM